MTPAATAARTASATTAVVPGSSRPVEEAMSRTLPSGAIGDSTNASSTAPPSPTAIEMRGAATVARARCDRVAPAVSSARWRCSAAAEHARDQQRDQRDGRRAGHDTERRQRGDRRQRGLADRLVEIGPALRHVEVAALLPDRRRQVVGQLGDHLGEPRPDRRGTHRRCVEVQCVVAVLTRARRGEGGGIRLVRGHRRSQVGEAAVPRGDIAADDHALAGVQLVGEHLVGKSTEPRDPQRLDGDGGEDLIRLGSEVGIPRPPERDVDAVTDVKRSTERSLGDRAVLVGDEHLTGTAGEPPARQRRPIVVDIAAVRRAADLEARVTAADLLDRSGRRARDGREEERVRVDRDDAGQLVDRRRPSPCDAMLGLTTRSATSATSTYSR